MAASEVTVSIKVSAGLLEKAFAEVTESFQKDLATLMAKAADRAFLEGTYGNPDEHPNCRCAPVAIDDNLELTMELPPRPPRQRCRTRTCTPRRRAISLGPIK